MAKQEYFTRVTLSLKEVRNIITEYCDNHYSPQDGEDYPAFELEFPDHLDLSNGGDKLTLISTNQSKEEIKDETVSND